MLWPQQERCGGGYEQKLNIDVGNYCRIPDEICWKPEFRQLKYCLRVNIAKMDIAKIETTGPDH